MNRKIIFAKKNTLTQKGAAAPKTAFTLIETLIYLALASLVITGFIYYVLSISGNRNKTYSVAEVQANGRIALELISQRIRSATGVNIASSTFNSDPGVLSLSMASSTLNPTVIKLTANDGRMQIIEGTSSAVLVTSRRVAVTNLTFTNLSSKGKRKNIQIDMTVNYANPGSIYFNASQTWSTTVSTRQ